MTKNALNIRVFAASLLTLFFFVAPSVGADLPEIAVYKSASCGCCKAWVEHLRESGFSVITNNVDGAEMNTIKQRYGVEVRASSCHTARVGGYTIEGHVPAVDIRRLLRERPDVDGLTVPGMPEGSPGMEGPNPHAYHTYSFRPGSYGVFAEHLPGK